MIEKLSCHRQQSVAPVGTQGRAQRRGECGPSGVGPRGDLQLLHAWHLAPEEEAAGLAFHALDGNPRHGLLLLFVSCSRVVRDAVEVFERQGRWLVMPDRARAIGLARQREAWYADVLAARAGIAGTPDGAYAFFNARQEQQVAAWVRRSGDPRDA